AAGKPIVALESTIISHGMPYPQNVHTAREVEQVIRDAGAVPATIAIIGGKICVGLSEDQLETLGSSPDAIKVSRRDLPYVLAQARLGATTVAA
ncbi:MAG TPA: pseudouridine-5-phosphate glycosidase, partial [Massilia timonae]|nr:pseudouridine-5-phosphate glycosidase [Massilia timonae]